MKTELVRLNQVSKILDSAKDFPSMPKDGWLRTVRTALGMTVVDAAKRAKVTPATWIAAEKREAGGTISLGNLEKFLSALGCGLSYSPISELPLEKMLEREAYEFVRKEVSGVRSTMAIENQAPGKRFSDRIIEERAEDIIRSGNWKGIWR